MIVTRMSLSNVKDFCITDAFAEAVKQSDFFKKMLGLETEEPKKNQKKKTDEKQEVTAEE